MDKILIRGLKIITIVGVYEWERKIPQTVVLDLEMAADIRAAAAHEDLSKTVDYKAVADRLTDYIQQQQFELIETMAEYSADLVLTEFNVESVTLRVSKPEAVAEAETVCVEITRQRND